MPSASPPAATRMPPAPGCARRRSPMRQSIGRQQQPPDHSGVIMEDKRQWPLYEVFVRARGGLDHKHVGSLHAADARMAIEHARDLYTRRQEGVSIWVVPSSAIVASDP